MHMVQSISVALFYSDPMPDNLQIICLLNLPCAWLCGLLPIWSSSLVYYFCDTKFNSFSDVDFALNILYKNKKRKGPSLIGNIIFQT